MRPAMAAASAVGAAALQQTRMAAGVGVKANIWSASEEAVIVGKSSAALGSFASDRRWSRADANGVKPWTDDYTDLFGALLRHRTKR